METTLSKWGNSKAVRVPVEACDELGLSLGDRAEVTVDAEHGVLVLKFERSKRAYARTRRMTMEEFAAGWDGGKVGAEWSGCNTGAEVVG